ncbi:PP2C family protein-serine/threonine phosphatase [Mucilaginibacter celer]|uniref:Serine/threonine-protein phosphatase n=1 Tax=Mucilaginibacter celer TaxID=2305508 RepID=A0A494VMK3_9SPHI|nr:protein phosphatase 2C domain-containing protein [Mucilaginibacter celer]AYL94170.1 serine/threonine-protein phosphatase [Mucilaginibacter celer]
MASNFFGITDTGKQRQNNEDVFIAEKSGDGNFIIACVIDGVGGYAGGEIAAEIARATILEQLQYIAGDIVPLLVNTFKIANQRIYDEKAQNKELSSMACVLTLVVADLLNNKFYYAHVGDTRLYLLRDYSLIKISKDHSFVGFLEDSGRLSEEAAMDHPKRNEINKALGFTREIDHDPEFVETGSSPFLPGDILLICSDGLTDLVDKSKITNILTTGEDLPAKGKKLIEAANNKGGKDNVTVVLVHNDKERKQHATTKPTSTATKPVEQQEVVAKPVAQKEQTPATVVKTKGNGGTVAILSILCFIFLGGFIWQFKKNSEFTVIPKKTDTLAAQPIKNAQELKLQDTINKLKGNTLVLSAADFKQPIVLTDTLHINKDSIYIKTKGEIIFKKDSTYKGPAIVLAAKCKYVVLDSVAFDGFRVGIATRNDALVLKNVRFNNCAIPVLTGYLLPNMKYISGRSLGSLFKADTIPSKTTH